MLFILAVKVGGGGGGCHTRILPYLLLTLHIQDTCKLAAILHGPWCVHITQHNLSNRFWSVIVYVQVESNVIATTQLVQNKWQLYSMCTKLSRLFIASPVPSTEIYGENTVSRKSLKMGRMWVPGLHRIN